MDRLRPVSPTELIRRLRILGFAAPESGGKHAFMQRGTVRVRIPNPHQGDIGVDLLGRVIAQAGVDRAEWGQSAKPKRS